LESRAIKADKKRKLKLKISSASDANTDVQSTEHPASKNSPPADGDIGR